MLDISGAWSIVLAPHIGNIRQYPYRMHWCLALGIFYAWRTGYIGWFSDAQHVLGYFCKTSWLHALQHHLLHFSREQLLWQQIVDLLLQLLLLLQQQQLPLQHHQVLLQKATDAAITTINTTTTTGFTATTVAATTTITTITTVLLQLQQQKLLLFVSSFFSCLCTENLNSLTPEIRQCQTLATFRCHLKTHYFQSAFSAT